MRGEIEAGSEATGRYENAFSNLGTAFGAPDGTSESGRSGSSTPETGRLGSRPLGWSLGLALWLPAWLVGAMGVALALGCGVKTVREPVYSGGATGEVEAYLRRYEDGGEAVPRGFDHPVLISPVRAAHMLAFVDVEEGSGDDREARPAVPPEMIYEVGEALARALEKAGPDDEVVVRALRRDRRLGIFTTRFLSSFVASVEDDRLRLSFGHVDWELPKFGSGRPGQEDLPEPIAGERQMSFRVVPRDAFVTLGGQSVAFDWRDDRFREPEQMQITPTGEVRRRTILLQGPAPSEGEAGASDEPRAAEPSPEPLPEGLSPAALRRLADLEEARRRGEITEAEYQRRRRRLLSE